MGILEKSLTIKRVPTVLSNYQEELVGGPFINTLTGCGRNCLGNCCLPVSKLPLYECKRDEEGGSDEPAYTDEVMPFMSYLVQILLGQWEDRAVRGLFRYDVTQCETKVIPGKSGFIAQLNEGRHLKKRATEFRIDQVLQPFDDNKFNFTKVGQEEALLLFQLGNGQKSHYYPSSSVTESDSPNIIAINVSPIEYGHVLLIPRVLDKLPQCIDHASFLLALSMAKEAADAFFRVGYNSLGAFATINHLHFQAYYIKVPFAVEKAPIQKLYEKNNGVIVSQLLNYPVRGLVFESGNTIQDLSDAVVNACIFLQKNNIPFNVLISGFGKRIFLFPQCYAEKQALGHVSQEILETQVNPACWEISGHVVLKSREDYEKATEEYACRLLAEVSLSEERFQAVMAQVLEAIGLQQPDVKGDVYTTNEVNQKNLNLYESSPPMTDT